MSSRTRFRVDGRVRFVLTALVFALVAAACGRGDLPQDALTPEGPEARSLDKLWNLVFPIAVVIFILVQGAVLYIAWKFRARSDEDAPVQVHGSSRLEIAWTIAPALLLAVVGVFTVVTLFDINEKAEGAEVLHVNVTGHQWWWEYEYPEQGIVTANELHIPAGRQVQLSLTAVDVIHNFWAPKLGGKVYAIPGRTNHMRIEADEPGDYSGQCAEYCGLSHANMRLRVIAHDAEDFEDWVAGQQRDAARPSSRVEAGAQLFINRGCGSCHTVQGLEGAGGKVGPNLTHLFSRKTFAGAIFDLDEKNLRRWLRDPPAMKPMAPENNQGMPNLGLSDEDITALIAYLETLE